MQWKKKNSGFSFICGFYNLAIGNFSDLGLLNPKEQDINVNYYDYDNVLKVAEMETLMQN